jgi:hypothetical protein
LVCSDTKAVGTSCLFLPAVVCFKYYLKNLFLTVNPKRKRALLESNPPAIRLMVMINKQCNNFYAAFLLISTCMA